ncbi:transcriptional Coactivator p15-domain-containing protein [Epithele typhae]|uniref:transcriptional Coactivator p15-domain-containing protein n=1 Tax=Epithele typhae TaxID=378194 RepID=UPI0020071FE4|nr:transcriptional Coactivator p15-domain-containing protein [Epithele typhae]KAH9917880.1 transcriptional Coactivator p15-domain-containing protein [Epithele typhae]
MTKRKELPESSSDDEGYVAPRGPSSSPDKPLGRSSGKKAARRAEPEEDSESEEEPIRAKAQQGIKKPKKKLPPPSETKGPKKPKRTAPAKSAIEDDMDTGDVKTGVTATGERYIELSKKRRATVTTFKGGKFLDIREYYGDEDDLKPGKKGISINREQWETLKKGAAAIDAFFAKLNK